MLGLLVFPRPLKLVLNQTEASLVPVATLSDLVSSSGFGRALMSLDQASKVIFPGSATGTNMHKPMGPFSVEARVTSLYSKDIFFIFSGQGEIGSVFRF